MWGSWNGYGVDGEDAAAWTVGKFAIGAIAAYDQNGPMIEVIGTQSWIGVILVVKWLNLYISLGVILAIQLILGIFVAFKANSVYCKDDSYLSTSRLLRREIPFSRLLPPSYYIIDLLMHIPRDSSYGTSRVIWISLRRQKACYNVH